MNKNSIKGNYFAFFIITIIATFLHNNLLAQCPIVGDVLNHGHTGSLCPVPGNFDEFGVVDDNPFVLKVNNYPPVRAFPITASSGCGRNLSFPCLGLRYK